MCKLQIVFLGLLVTKEGSFLKSRKATPSTMKNIMLCYYHGGPLVLLG